MVNLLQPGRSLSAMRPSLTLPDADMRDPCPRVLFRRQSAGFGVRLYCAIGPLLTGPVTIWREELALTQVPDLNASLPRINHGEQHCCEHIINVQRSAM